MKPLRVNGRNPKAATHRVEKRNFTAWLRAVIRAFNDGASSVCAALWTLLQFRGVPFIALFVSTITITWPGGDCQLLSL